MKAVIFGLGKRWNLIKDYISEELEITAYMDNNADKLGGGIFTR